MRDRSVPAPATRGARTPAERASDPGPSDGFRRSCSERGVAEGDVAALWTLHRRWGRPETPEAERLAQLLEDHAHWRLYVASRDGDQTAAGAFDQHWRRYIRAFLGRRFLPDQVEEITSLFFSRVYRLVGSEFDWHCPFEVYLRAALINVVRDETARLVRRRNRLVSIDAPGADGEPVQYATTAPSPEDQALRRERDRAVMLAVAELKPVDRHIVVACLMEGASGQDLAAELGMTRDALYQRLHRARARLRRAIDRGSPVSEPPGRRV